MSAETKKWLWLFALLAGMAYITWLFLTEGPAILARLLSGGGIIIPVAMAINVKWDRLILTCLIGALIWIVGGALIVLLAG
jgi:hypothetical protein